jgi:hypothetical protein
MIVVYREDNTLRLIRQTDHAHVSGQVAGQWRRPTDWPESSWARFVDAVTRHDEGWLEMERAPPLDNAGRPYTFKNLPTAEHVTVWRHGINKLAHDDAYRGLVLALHAHWLYTQLARNDEPAGEAAANEFVQWLDQRIDTLAGQMQGGDATEQQASTPARLDQTRRLIGVFDMVSLVLLRALDVNDWAEPLPFGERCEAVRLHRPDVHALAVEPWPFARQSVTVSLPGYDLPRQQFESPEQLGRLLEQCAPVTLTFEITPVA